VSDNVEKRFEPDIYVHTYKADTFFRFSETDSTFCLELFLRSHGRWER